MVSTMVRSSCLWRSAVSCASRSACSAARCSVMSRAVPTRPTTSPEALRRGTLVVRSHRGSPSISIGSSMSAIGSPEAITARSSARNLEACSSWGYASCSVIPTRLSGSSEPKARALARLRSTARPSRSLTKTKSGIVSITVRSRRRCSAASSRAASRARIVRTRATPSTCAAPTTSPAYPKKISRADADLGTLKMTTATTARVAAGAHTASRADEAQSATVMVPTKTTASRPRSHPATSPFAEHSHV